MAQAEKIKALERRISATETRYTRTRSTQTQQTTLVSTKVNAAEQRRQNSRKTIEQMVKEMRAYDKQ